MALRIRSNRLRELRRRSGFSGYDLQALSGVPAHIIYLIERGLQRPACYQKFAIAKSLNVPEEEVFPSNLVASKEVVDD